MHSTKISGLAVDTEYTFHLVLRTSAGTFISDRVPVRTHKMTDLSGITITTGILPGTTKEHLIKAVERIGAKIVEGVRIDTTHFVTTEGRGQQWEKAVESNIPVVRPEWVDACEKTGRILGVTKFYLDAMKPGPPSEEPSPHPHPHPPPPPEKNDKKEEKDLPAPPAQNGEQSAKPEEKKEEQAQKNGDTESSSSEDDDVPEQKAKAEQQAEQKVRFEDKEENKVALRPAGSERKSEDKDDKKAKVEDESDDEVNAKTAATPDGASFQEVEL